VVIKYFYDLVKFSQNCLAVRNNPSDWLSAVFTQHVFRPPSLTNNETLASKLHACVIDGIRRQQILHNLELTRSQVMSRMLQASCCQSSAVSPGWIPAVEACVWRRVRRVEKRTNDSRPALQNIWSDFSGRHRSQTAECAEFTKLLVQIECTAFWKYSFKASFTGRVSQNEVKR